MYIYSYFSKAGRLSSCRKNLQDEKTGDLSIWQGCEGSMFSHSQSDRSPEPKFVISELYEPLQFSRK